MFSLNLKQWMAKVTDAICPHKYEVVTAGNYGSLNGATYNYIIVTGKQVTLHLWVKNLSTTVSSESCIAKIPAQYAPSHNVYFSPNWTARTTTYVSSPYAFVQSNGNILCSASVVSNATQILGTCTWFIGE